MHDVDSEEERTENLVTNIKVATGQPQMHNF